MKVVYIAGPFRSREGFWGVVQNIRRAEDMALHVWKSGAVALCPHLNTANFEGAAPDRIWLEGDLELLRRCDAVMLVDGWERSSGARAEKALAEELGKPVFNADGRWVEEFSTWIAKARGETP